MSNRIFTLFFIFNTIVAVAQPATIKGSLPVSFAGKVITLTRMNYETREDEKELEGTIGSTGAFTLSVALTQPAIFELRVGDSSVLHLLARPKDAIGLQLRKSGIICSGSVDTRYLIDYEANRRKVFNKWLRPTYDSSAMALKTGNKERIEYWNVEHEKASENYKAELGQWVKQPFFINSLAAVHHSLRWHSDNDLALMDEMVAIDKRKYPDLELTRQLVSKVNSTKRIALGAIAPDFQSTNTEGAKIELSSYRGKFMLVDFWASWCGPCRQESPTLVRLYNTYKEHGFDIISVSIDTDDKKWRAAILKDGYAWQNVSELKGYAGATAALYAVTAIPNSFLLDKDGKIIGKNLRGKNLEKKLAELMGN